MAFLLLEDMPSKCKKDCLLLCMEPVASTPALSVALSHIRLPNVTWQRSAHILGAAGNLPIPWSVKRKPSYALVTTSMVVTHKIAAIKKNVFTMCYKIFTTKAEHKKCCQGGFPQRCGFAWQTARSLPSQPQQGSIPVCCTIRSA